MIKQTIIFSLMILFAACSSKMQPLQSTMHTEPLHKKWIVQKMEGAVILPETVTKPVIDMTDVYHSYANAGCDKIIYTPKFNHGNRILFAHTQITERSCKGSTQLDAVLLRNLQNAYYWELHGERLIIKNKFLKPIVEAEAIF